MNDLLNPRRRPLSALMVCLGLVSLEAMTAEPPVKHESPAHAASGIKWELIEGITESDFLKPGDKPQSVKITLIAAFTQDNYGMNFNGFSKGKAIYTIPKGWNVEVTFINPSPVPHSALVVERDMVKKIQVGPPAFDGASVPNPTQGMSLKKSVFTFLASEEGDYALCCGFPAHAISGHWVALNVRAGLDGPTLKLGDAEPRGIR